MVSWILTVISFCTITLGMTSGQSDPTVTTNLGKISGRVQGFGKDCVYQFLGIRYALPPTGTLRFKKPVPRGRWSGTLDASKYGPSCIQLPSFLVKWLPNMETDEDCLLLNIYVPRTLSPNTTKSVMTWIHGGGFIAGQGMINEGSNLALTGDVIVVTINYRLDVFGFLSTGDISSAGNYGLWDMLLAIKFVKDNIAGFGGNPNSITIFGESAGAYAIGSLILSPHSKGLFQRAICESGVGLSPKAIAFDPGAFTRKISDGLGCTAMKVNGTLDTAHFMTCIQQKPTEEILNASAVAREPSTLAWRIEIAPSVDGEILPARPEFLISPQNKQFYNPMFDIDFMAGTNSAEGSLLFFPLRNYQHQLNISLIDGIPTRVLCDNVSTSFSNDYYEGSKSVADGICKLYSTDKGEVEQGRKVVDLYGDMMFVAPTVLTATTHSRNRKGKNTYVYLFDEHLPLRPNQPWWFVGAPHAGELDYVFGRRVSHPSLSLQMMKYWTNFAKFGNPNGSPEAAQIHWQQYDGFHKNYMYLGSKVQMKQDLWPERLKFFTTLTQLSNTHRNYPEQIVG